MHYSNHDEIVIRISRIQAFSLN